MRNYTKEHTGHFRKKSPSLNDILILIALVFMIIFSVLLHYKVLTKQSYNEVGSSGYEKTTPEKTFSIGDSGSMKPTFDENNYIIAEDVTNLTIGNIYIYDNRKGNKIVHRLVCISDYGYFFKGDNNNATDKPIKRDMIMYQVKNITDKK